MTFLRPLRQLLAVVVYAPKRPARPMASVTFISGGRARSARERRRRAHKEEASAPLATARGMTAKETRDAGQHD